MLRLAEQSGHPCLSGARFGSPAPCLACGGRARRWHRPSSVSPRYWSPNDRLTLGGKSLATFSGADGEKGRIFNCDASRPLLGEKHSRSQAECCAFLPSPRPAAMPLPRCAPFSNPKGWCLDTRARHYYFLRFRGVDHRQDARRRAFCADDSRGVRCPHLRNCEGVNWNVCGWPRIAGNWRETFPNPL